MVKWNVRIVLIRMDSRLVRVGRLLNEKLACDKMSLLGS